MDSVLPLSTITVARFLGLTQESSDLRDLLCSICEQILTCLGRDQEAVPVEFAEVLKFFSNLLHEIPSSIQLILLLDSLNSLLPDFNAHLLQWLPSELPKNVKIIVSCQPHAHGMFTRIKTEIITDNHDNFIEMRPLGEEKAMQLTLHWLQRENMCLTNSQAEILREAFRQCSLPLYIQLAFDRVKQWRSFDHVDAKVLGTSCETYLDIFFTELETRHGSALVKHAVSYLTASKTGLSDMEMEDMLSLDEVVMGEIHNGKSPVIRRCPPGVWASLRDDLDPLLKLTVADDYDIYFWMHAVVRRFVEHRYLGSLSHLKTTHYMIADYYLGHWHNKPMACISASGKELATDRHVLSQPLAYTNILGETHYNKRKYDQVPRHLYLADRLDELNGKVMFNYDWLYNKIKALSLQKILADLNLNPSIEATLLEGALRSSQAVLLKNINNMPVELSGHLLPYYHIHSNIRSLIDQCDTSGLTHCSLVPKFNYHQVPGSPLQYTFECVETVDTLLISEDERYILAKADNSQKLRKFDLLTGETQGDIITSYGRAHLSPDNRHIVLVDNEIEKSVKVHDAVDGAYLFQLIPTGFLDTKEQRKYQLGTIALSSQYIAILITTHTTHLCIASVEQQDFVRVVDMGGKSTVVSIAENQNYLLCNSGSNIIAYSLSTYEPICSTPIDIKPACLVASRSSTKVFLTDESSHIIHMLLLNLDGHTQMVSKIPLHKYFHGDHVRSMALTRDERMLMVRGECNIVIYQFSTDEVSAHIRRPSTVLKEFRLPKHSKPTEIIYTDAIFSHDDATLMTSLFRNIQFWDLKTGLPLSTTILAPVGIVTKICQSSFQSQIITVQHDAHTIQVWNLADYNLDVTSLDRLTSPIENLVLTEDNQICFATGTASDEVGVIDMNTGLLTNLLTHEGNIVEISPTSDGAYLLVALEPSKAEFCNKLWSVNDRQIIKEFGRSNGLTTTLRNSNMILHISQVSTEYQAPYVITVFNFTGGTYYEWTYDFVINYAISKPFVTAEDTYMVLLTADRYIEREARHSNPSICAFYLKGRYMHSIIGRNELSPFLNTRHITALLPIAQNNTDIIAIYKPCHEGHPINGAYGFVSLDLATGSILRYSDNFMPSNTELKSLYLTNDGSRCLNSDLGMIFAMNTGQHLASVDNEQSKVALLSCGKIVAYYRGPHLVVERIEDNKILARCNTHADICRILVSNDDRTIMVGCVDGTVLSYVLIEPDADNVQQVVTNVVRRQVSEPIEGGEERPHTASTWDQTDTDRPKSRLLSSIDRCKSSQRDRDVLKNIRPVYRSMTAVKTRGSNGVTRRVSTATHNRSQACSVM